MKELVLTCPEQYAEQLSDALLDVGALSVSVEDADLNTEDEMPLYGEPGMLPEVNAWRNNKVIALLPTDTSIEQLFENMRIAGYGEYLTFEWVERQIPDNDWVSLTQSQFEPIQIGKKVWIVPSWHRENPDIPEFHRDDTNYIKIELDPGLAFGTGSHPTTHLCADWLQQNLQPGQSVLDYGCGSGILSIIAKKLGAADTYGVDIDPQAIESSIYNAKNNGVIINAMLPDALPSMQFNIVVANILSSPLKVMASMLASKVSPNGHLVLSGILEWQAEELIEAYAPYMNMQVWQARDEWVCLYGQQLT